jgi:FixJ family two-component response regulator
LITALALVSHLAQPPTGQGDIFMPVQGPQKSASNSEHDAPVVVIVDDDPLMRASLRRLLVRAGLTVEAYASGAEFLAVVRMDRLGCLLLDASMPGMSGLEVQISLNDRGASIPVIFLTGTADIPIAVAAMRAGASDFIEKPFENADLLERVRRAIDRHRDQRADKQDRQAVLQRLNTLTPRERAVLEQIVAGKTSKETARVLGSSHRTIDIHRGNLMEKMAVTTLADLVRARLLVG